MGSSVILPSPGQPKTGPDPGFKSGSVPTIVSFNFDNVAPPSPVYIQRDDKLGIQVITNQSVETVTVNARLLMPQRPQPQQPDTGPPDPALLAQSKLGFVLPIVQQILGGTILNFGTVLGGTSQKTAQVDLAEGYLLSVAAQCVAATQRGATFVRCWINRQGSVFPLTNVYELLFGDYVTTTQPAGWPYGRQLAGADGPGNMQALTAANPAAGADFVVAPSGNLRWRIQAVSALLTTSAAVANRIVHAEVEDSGGVTLSDVAALTAQVASTAVQYTFMPGVSSQATVDGAQLISLPPAMFLDNGMQIASETTGIQAGDQWSNIRFYVEMWNP